MSGYKIQENGKITFRFRTKVSSFLDFSAEQFIDVTHRQGMTFTLLIEIFYDEGICTSIRSSCSIFSHPFSLLSKSPIFHSDTHHIFCYHFHTFCIFFKIDHSISACFPLSFISHMYFDNVVLFLPFTFLISLLC